MSGPVLRPDWTEHGLRTAECANCGMSWLEHRDPPESPGSVFAHVDVGERDHKCPEPYPRAIAEQLLAVARATGGIVVSATMQARIRLGLREDPPQ